MAGFIQEDLAMSCTYLPDTRTTYSVFYGCSDAQSRAIEKRIRSAGDDANHPLLMVGIFVELEYRRLVNAVEALMDMFVTEVDVLEHGRPHDPDATTQRLLKICLKAQTLADQIRSIKRQLAKVSAEFDELVRFWQSEEYASILSGPEGLLSDPSKDSSDTSNHGLDWRVDNDRKERMVAIARQMGERIRDIQDEYDDKLDECNTMAQTGYNHTARLDSLTNARIARANTDIAIETKRESSQMRYIALLTMIFLPLSCVASVFSTTIFNWEPEDGHPVVSSYIWVLLGIALLLTIVTVLAWWFFTWRERKREEQKRNEDPEKGMRQP